MNVISLKDYAKQNNVSYEAVRQQVVRYKDDLGSHIIRDGRQQFLDEEAVAFLDARRQKNPVAIIQMDKDDQIDHLEKENKFLLQKLTAVQDALLAEKEKTQQLLDEKKDQIALLEADNEAAKLKVAEAEEDAQKAQQALTDAHAAFEEDLQKKNEQIEAWEKYAADLQQYHAAEAAYQKRWFKKKKDKPVPPVPPELQEG